jgi:hypothetical protein
MLSWLGRSTVVYFSPISSKNPMARAKREGLVGRSELLSQQQVTECKALDGVDNLNG